MSKAKLIGAVAGVVALALVGSAWGNSGVATEAAPGAAPTLPMANAVAKDNPLGLPAVDTRTLAAGRGGADVFNDMQLKGVVAENQAINVSTGHNAITGGAFANASGVPMVVQNSGNNVLIQNATIINLQMK